MHNLIKIGDLVTPQSDAVQIMSMVMKDISPKWRMMFVRKLFQAGKVGITLCSQRCVYSQKVRTLSGAMSKIITKT